MSPLSSAALALVVHDVVKRFGEKVAIDHVTFQVKAGETVVLWGPNGAGKTTLLRCILGLIRFEGAITVLGCDTLREGKAARGLLGFVPQELGLHGEQTVMEAVTFYARLRRVPLAQALSLLETWQLTESSRSLVRTLSGGMKQKLALVIALLANPPMLLLDEPTSNLDVRTRRELSTVLEQLKTAGRTILFCSHRTSEVSKLADRVIVLEQGRKIEEGAPEAVRHHLSERLVLSLTLSPSHKAQAALLLEHHGFTVELNGTHMWVHVIAGRKVEPLQLLAEAKIPVVDFEIEQAPTERPAPMRA
ncbi:MAG: ABC transporter ATP-binding protein [Deltaproteobacteria bacterium]|nr:ABC transporter ATP-binding protein [Deltaproteobacteria bacterium]